MVPRITLGLPVPVMRGMVARLVVLNCLVVARVLDLVNRVNMKEGKDLGSM